MKITAGESRILSLLAQDLTVKEIANRFGKSIHTIQNQIRSAKLKLHCGTSHGLVAKFLLTYEYPRRKEYQN